MSNAWRPNPGETIVGRLIGADEGRNVKGLPYPILTLATTGDGEIVKVHALHQVLQQELAKRAPTLDDELTITYHGQPDGKDYHHYTVQGGRQPSIDWARYRDPHDPEPAPATTPSTAVPASSEPITDADLASIRRLLKTIAAHDDGAAHAYEERIVTSADGKPLEDLDAVQGAAAVGWLKGKVDKLTEGATA